MTRRLARGAALAGFVVLVLGIRLLMGHLERAGEGSSAAAPAAASIQQAGTAGQAPPNAAGTPPSCGQATAGLPASARRRVSSAAGLAAALAHARPGQAILLAPGVYRGDFTATVDGGAGAPITLCGPRSAVLEGTSTKYGYVLYLNGASWWRVLSFTVYGGQKGIVTSRADHDLLSGLYVHSTGEEGVHLRSFSSSDTISHSVIRATGRRDKTYGEGIYIGSAHKNWCRYSRCEPDASNQDSIIGNDISGTTAENIDIKEGTTGGLIEGNHLSGAGMSRKAATAWVNVKGNDWVVEGNTGTGSIGDGFEDLRVVHGWGTGNVFRGNTARVDGPGYGFYVASRHLQVTVGCDNSVSGAAKGLSNIGCMAS